jgi:phage major head subunit gpT-like protein
MDLTPTVLKNILTGFKAIYQAAYDSAPFFWNKIATEVPSSDKQEIYGWLLRIPTLREWIGDRLVQNAALASYTLRNKHYELTEELDRDDVEDDSLGRYKPLVEMMGLQARKWPDYLLAALLQAGTTEKAFDGKAFFADDHPKDISGRTSGTYDNNFASTALSTANYDAVRTAMMSYVGEDGKPLGVRPNLLVVPPQLERTARTILNAELIPSAAGTASETNVLRGSADLLVVPELANEATTWYLLDVSKPIKPFVFQLRKAPQFVTKTAIDDDSVFWKNKFHYGVDARGNVGFTLPFLAARAAA